MFIYRTRLFEEQVQQQSKLDEQIDRLCDELAAMSVEQVQSRFERIYPFLKRKEGNLRLVARIYRIDKTPILCWLTLFRRGDRAYEEFLRDREDSPHQSWASEVETPQLRAWLQQQQASPPETASPLLPETLQPWLERPHWAINTNRLLIYGFTQPTNLSCRCFNPASKNWRNDFESPRGTTLIIYVSIRKFCRARDLRAKAVSGRTASSGDCRKNTNYALKK